MRIYMRPEASNDVRSGQKGIETEAVEFGNGAHVTVPKEWVGSMVRLRRVGSYVPPMFHGVEEGKTVFVEVDSLDAPLSGDVIEFKQNPQEEYLQFRLRLDTGHDIYRLTTKRPVGADSWDDSECTIEKVIDGDEMQETDEIIEMSEGGLWKPVGAVTGVAVQRDA